MFCPNCGNADQLPETFCRQCGTFLPDFDNPKHRKTTPEEHLKVNTVLNFMTAIACMTLAIVLYAYFLGKAETPVIIYITAGFLTAMFAWQVQIIIRTYKLKSHLKNRRVIENKKENVNSIENKETAKLLNEADFTDLITPSVTEHTTKNLNKVHRN